MKREHFKEFINSRSCWTINKIKGNFEIQNGKYLSDYVKELIKSQMKINMLGIKSDGDLCYAAGIDLDSKTEEFNNYILMPDFQDIEICSYDEMEKRIDYLIHEMLY